MSKNEPRIREIPLEEIDRSRNYRIPKPGDTAKLESMKKSIEACGQLEPIRLYERGEHQQDKKHKEPYILCFGNRRCQAMALLGRTTIQAVVFPPAPDADIIQARAIENVQREDFNAMEEVLAVADMLETIKADPTFAGDAHEKAAARFGCEVKWVRDRDYLQRLSKPVQKFALQSDLPAGHLRELSKVGDPKDQMRLACEMAGAPVEAFPFDPKETKLADWQKHSQEVYFAGLQDGKVSRWPLSRLMEQVAKLQYSLKIIPWAFDQPVELGSVKLRKCAGCPHNSETDRTLFEIKEDTANPQGYCLNASCYEAKHAAVEAAKQQVLKKISNRADQTPAAIRKVAPQWMKETSVVGFVKRQLDKADRPATPSSKNRGTSDVREFTEHEKALQKFADAFHAWEKKAWTLVFKAINSDPEYRVSWCVLLGVADMWDHPRMKLPMVQRYAQPQTEAPELPTLMAEFKTAVASAFSGTREGWMEVLKRHEQIHPDHRSGFGIPHPRILELLAQCMKVKLPAAPQWKPVEVPPEGKVLAPSPTPEVVAA